MGRDGVLGIVHICDEAGHELPTEEIGTVYWERDQVPFEYHNDPVKTASAQHPDHPTWTTSGDIGYLDDDRFLYLTDRAAFTIISGGVNIYPQESENVLTLHPKVYDVAVIGVPHDEMGEEVKAVVQLVDGVTGTQTSNANCSTTSASASRTTRRPDRSTSSTTYRAPPPGNSSSTPCARGTSRRRDRRGVTAPGSAPAGRRRDCGRGPWWR